jgi:hypothetical protein
MRIDPLRVTDRGVGEDGHPWVLSRWKWGYTNFFRRSLIEEFVSPESDPAKDAHRNFTYYKLVAFSSIIDTIRASVSEGGLDSVGIPDGKTH